MKLNFKFSVLFFAITMLTIFSCKDDISVEDNRAKMVGSWKATTFSQANCNDADDNISLVFGENGACFDQEVTPGVTGTGCVIVDFTFAENGTLASDFNTVLTVAGFPVSDETESTTGTWEVLDLTRMTVCIDGDCSTGTYVVTDTNLTYNGNDADTGCAVTFTATKQ